MIRVKIQLKRDNFNVEIDERFDYGITGIYGPSGSGKTSLLYSIAGLATPQKGIIEMGGRTVFSSEKKINIPVNERQIGYVFQEGRLFPHMSVRKNLQYGMKKHQPQLMDFDDVVELLQLGHLLNSRPHNISGGERQRTALGRALLSNPKLMLLDEPFSAVDVRLREQILPFLLKIHKTTKIPLLVVSHDITDLLKLTNKLCIIEKGEITGHDDYHRLIRNKKINGIFKVNSIINSVNLKVLSVKSDTGLTILGKEEGNNSVKVLCEKSKQGYNVNEELKVFIRSDDIALSTEPLSEITIQNQLKGEVTEIIERNNTMLCMVDVGFPLVVEITSESLKRMQITLGMTIWCLFKSVAIDVAG